MPSRRLQRDFFLVGNELQMLRNQISGNAVKIEALAATQNGRQNLLRLGRGENKFHMRRRFFERLQKGVERRRRQHVHFVDEINFVTTLRRRITNVLAQLAHVLDAIVAGAIDLDHVEAVAAGDLAAIVALSAWRDGRSFEAIEGFGQNTRGRCFADAAWPDKQIRMRQPVLCDGVFQRTRDMRLPDEIVESLRPIFSCENFVTHRLNLDGKVDGW